MLLIAEFVGLDAGRLWVGRWIRLRHIETNRRGWSSSLRELRAI